MRVKHPCETIILAIKLYYLALWRRTLDPVDDPGDVPEDMCVCPTGLLKWNSKMWLLIEK